MEPLFCKNTGEYLARTADFCSHCDSPNAPFKLVPPSAPMDIDAFSWVRECPEKTAVRLHPNTELRGNVRSILNRKQSSVSLLINRDSGCFVELGYLPEKISKNFIPVQNLARHGGVPCKEINKLGSLAIGLIRHRLLESDNPTSLYNDKNTNRFMLEEGCEFLEGDGHRVIRNRYSGRAFSIIEPVFRFLVSGETLELGNKAEDLFPLFQNLCLGGMLRQVLPGKKGKI